MTHDERFAEFRAQREQERAAQVKVTWRKVSPMTGGGYSGLGPGGALVFVRRAENRWDGAKYEYGTVDGKTRTSRGGATTLHAAKEKAAALFKRCETCGGSGKRATAKTAGGRELERHERAGTPCGDCGGTGTAAWQ